MRRLGLPKLIVLGLIAAFALYMVGGARAAEVSRTELASNFTVSSTSHSLPDTVITAPALTADGTTTYKVEFGAPAVRAGNSSGNAVHLDLFEASTDLGELAWVQTPAAANIVVPVYGAVYVTPASGSRTYSLRAWQSAGTSTISGNSQGAATAPFRPYLRISTEDAGGGGGSTAWADITDKPTFNLSFLDDADTTGAIDGAVLKYDETASEWQVATDDAGGGGSSGPVSLSAGDRERLDLQWYGVWAIVGLLLCLMIAPLLLRLLDVRHGMGGRFERG